MGCAGGQRVAGNKASLSEISQIVDANLPTGRRAISVNGREHFSNYFVRNKEGEFVKAENVPVRFYAHIIVLGDRRPYEIHVRVFAQKRDSDGQYDNFKQDEGLARVISRRIEKSLYQRREDLNIIDDFRVF